MFKPPEELRPTYLSEYIYDKDFIKQINAWAQSCDQRLLRPIVTASAQMLQQRYSYVQSILTLREWAFGEQRPDEFKVTIHSDEKPAAKQVRKYKEPTSSEATAILSGLEDGKVSGRDIFLPRQAAL